MSNQRIIRLIKLLASAIVDIDEAMSNNYENYIGLSEDKANLLIAISEE